MSRKILVTMYTTIDGIAEAPIYEDETPEDDKEFWATMWNGPMGEVDTLLLGRISYQKWAEFWPTQLDSENENWRKFARWSTACEKVVFSHKPTETKWANSRAATRPLAQEFAHLRTLPGKNIIVAGGARFVQSVLAEDLEDELLLTMNPSLVGGGKPLFRVKLDPDHDGDMIQPGAEGRHDFRLLECHPFRSGAVFLRYGLGRPTAKPH